MRTLIMLAAAGCLFAALPAEAWTRKNDRIYGFRTSHCKTDQCFEKHPNGQWVHPLTYPKGHSRKRD
jgi:hypothetical protein